ncbi:MAG TPA: hypothetical protein VHA73_00695 [Acidimicrobiales bacterium]|nr:hypothetical protein [Acidimicrobiales bacterium]
MGSALTALFIVAASFITTGHASVAQTKQPDPTTEVLAVVSPIASPVCSTSGTATLLVPIVGGLVNQNLPKSVPSIADLILNALGPVYIACGRLPAAPGTRCQLDDQIAGLVPEQLSSTTGPTPGLLGDLLDSLDAGLKLLGVAPSAALQKALVCEVPAGAAVVTAPAAPPAAAPAAETPATPDTAMAALPADAGGGYTPTPTADASTPIAAPAPNSAAAAQQTTAAPTLIDQIAHRVPGGVRTLQGMLGIALALFLASSWTSSWQELRRGRSGT